MTDQWDALVVGAGPAGAFAAATLARLKCRTLLVDRASGPGLAGGAGLLTAVDRAELGSGLPEPLPVERQVIEHRWFFLDRRSSLSVDERIPLAGPDVPPLSTARLSNLESWLIDRARGVGAEVRWGVPVDCLVTDSTGKVTGALAAGTTISARLTIVCDPVVSEGLRSARPRSGRARAEERHAWVTLPMDAGKLERSFGLASGAGSVFDAILGFVEAPAMARGYVWTHRHALTVGVAARSSRAVDPTSVLADFRTHPSIQAYLGDEGPVEQGTFTRPTGRPEFLGGPGFLVAGEAAGFVFENGIVHEQLGYRLRSARLAAETGSSSLGANRTSDCTATYRKAISRAGVLIDQARSDAVARRVEWNPRWHHEYPHLLTEVFHRMMTETSRPKEPVAHAVRGALRSAGVRRRDLVKDALMAGVSL